MRALARRIVLPLLATLLALPLDAQTVRGRVVDAETGQPIAGAVVALADAQGARADAVLTRADGAYTVRAPAAGAYRVTAERVGYQSAWVEEALAPGQTLERELNLMPSRLVLEPVIARGVQRACTVRPQYGAEAAVLWDEARKALAAVDVGRQRRLYAYLARTVRRELALPGRRVTDSAVHVTAGYAAHPFRATAVERLAEHGFVEDGRDSITFHAPDAGTLLSDVFLDHHCFTVRVGTGAEAGLVGLEFAPLRGRRVPEVRGVLWLDRRTAALRHVEYAYTGLPWRGHTAELGGRVEFEQLADGAWIVRRWSVRMPRLGIDPQQGVSEVIGLIEHEGAITGIRPAQ